ncbi:prenyltransferase/squalene oxidase repeat-containing protein [Aeromicrobium sp. UC242_57]|uniref:prenyltransferase/squalene oxidase repeat-containing protein n=1 Tax=Aeromicrobium sp. UC242_57 TaxID=3374624 RepID=UPI0037BD7AA1
MDTALSMTVDRSEVLVGQSAVLSWDADAGDHLRASGAWNGERLLSGTETVTPHRAGTYIYRLDTVGAERPASRQITITVLDDDSEAPPAGGPDESQSAQARSTAGWLVNELSPVGHMPGPDVGTDWGLTIDTLFALYAAGTGASAVKDITAQVARHAGVYLGADLFGDPDARIGGSTAKLLVAAVVAGRDPEAFGTGKFLQRGATYDMRQETLDLIQKTGVLKGRLVNRGTGSEHTNVFAQSLAVIGLARSGGVPTDVVSFLRRQQCSTGYFRMFYQDGLSCDAGQGAPDPDGTALAVQALMTARDAGVDGLDGSIDRALDWLLGAQGKDGSIGGGVGAAVPNTNSTGLLAQALWAGAADTSGPRADEAEGRPRQGQAVGAGRPRPGADRSQDGPRHRPRVRCDRVREACIRRGQGVRDRCGHARPVAACHGSGDLRAGARVVRRPRQERSRR